MSRFRVEICDTFARKCVIKLNNIWKNWLWPMTKRCIFFFLARYKSLYSYGSEATASKFSCKSSAVSWNHRKWLNDERHYPRESIPGGGWSAEKGWLRDKSDRLVVSVIASHHMVSWKLSNCRPLFTSGGFSECGTRKAQNNTHMKKSVSNFTFLLRAN